MTMATCQKAANLMDKIFVGIKTIFLILHDGMSIKNNEFDVRLLIGQIQKQVFSIIFDYVLNIEISNV